MLGEWLIDLGADPKGDNRSSPVAPRPLVSALSQDQYINSPFQKSINKTPEAEKKSEENDQQMTSWVECLLERGASFQDSFDEPEHNYLTSVPEWKSPPKPEDYTVATWAKKARHGVFFARHLDQWIDYENTVARAIAHRDAISVSLSDIPAPTKKSKKNM